MSGSSDWTLTPNYNLYKPTYDADVDQWGIHWNSNADTIDTQMATAYPRTGGTLDGPITVSRVAIIDGGASGPSQLIMDTAAGGSRFLVGRTGASSRWMLQPGDTAAETGGNAGANFALSRYSDAGGFIDYPMRISRQTGVVDFSQNPTVAGAPLAPTVISDTPPTAAPGALWWDSIGGQLYVRYQDQNSLQWVAAQNASVSQTYTDTAVAGTLNNVGRNKLHNSMFAVAQRGAGPWTANDAFTIDRWQIGVALDTVSITQLVLSDAGRTAVGDEAANYALSNSFTGNAGATAVSFVRQKIEGVRRLANKTVTLSLWAVAGSGTPKLGINLYQNFGTGGSPSGAVAVQATGAAVTLSSTWTRYTQSFTIPSIVGKTLGTSGDDSTGLNFYFSSGANTNAIAGNIGVQSGTIQLWGVQLEIAQPGQTQPTPLEKPDPVQQLQQCQRFYEIGSFGMGGAAGGAGGGCFYGQQFAVTKRTSPTITTSGTNIVNMNTTSVSPVNNTGIQPYGVNIASGGYAFSGNYQASADL
jgi:hypothetical protein